MKKMLLLLIASCAASLSMAQNTPLRSSGWLPNSPLPASLQIGQRLVGSGEQNGWMGVSSLQNAPMVGDYGVYHVASYLPYSPTSATIWPRVVEVECEGQVCQPYDWKPSDGRAEYVYLRPKQKITPVPVAPSIVYVPGPREICKKSDG